MLTSHYALVLNIRGTAQIMTLKHYQSNMKDK